MDRRTVWAILLMMVIAITPAIFIKRPPRPAPGAADRADSSRRPRRPSGPVAPGAPAARATALGRPAARQRAACRRQRRRGRAPAHTVRVTSPLYTYGISTPGGRLVEARLHRYRSIAPADSGRTADILPPDSRLLGLTLVLGRDTIPLDELGVHGLDRQARRHRADAAPPQRLARAGQRGA